MSQPFAETDPESASGVVQLEAAAVLTIAEAAKLMRIGRNSMYEAARRGQIPTVRIGRRLLVPRAALELMLQRAGAAHGERGNNRD